MVILSSALVTVDWLSQHLRHPQLVVVDCRFSLADPDLGRQQYHQGHLPGAYYLGLNQDLSSPVQRHGGRHPLPDWAQFVETLNRLGIQSQPATSIVVYDDSRFAFAARLWWMLRYLGHDQVALLDGGFSAWHQAGLPITQALPTVKRGDFRAQPQPDWLVDIEAVRQRKDLPGVKLVDARAEERFRGEYEPIDPIAGSIPGAVNSFWQAVTDEAGYLKPTSDLIEHWSALDDAREVIMYCGSGVTACVNLFAQTMAGQPMGKLYSGGWSDWCSYQV